MTEKKTKSIQASLKATQASSPLFERPGFMIRRLHQIHTGLFVEETSRFSITPVQYSLLTALAAHGGDIDQNSLSLKIGLERSSVAEVLPRLEARGLLERRQSDQDKRVRLVRLTRAGKALVKRMELPAQRAHDRTIAHLPAAERELFMLQLVRLVEAHNIEGLVPLHLP